MSPRGAGRRLVRGAARTAVVAGTASAVSGRVHRHQQEKWAQEDYEEQMAQQAAMQAQAPPPPAPPAAPAASQDDMIDQLNKLASLHDSGVLSDEEFAAAKAKLLGT